MPELKYNKFYVPPTEDKKLLSQQVAMPLSYRQLVLIVNALDDLHAALQASPDERLTDYPGDEMESLHTEIVSRIVPCLASLEASYEAGD